MKKIILPILGLIAVLISGCSQQSSEQDEKEIRYRDSLLTANQELSNFLNIVAQELDSINQNPMVTISSTNNEGTPKTIRQKVLDNINAYQQTVDNQRQRIEELEKQLEANKGDNAKKMKEIVAQLKAQIAEKDREIAVLREQISQKDFNITQLQTHVSKLKENVENLEQQTKDQEEALVAQNEILNEAYVLIGTKKELKAAGVITNGNLFKKSKLNQSDFNKSKFKKIDMRNYTEVEISGKDPKILTPAPSKSYNITKKDNNSYILKISDPDAFWSVSPFLVIQTK